MMRRWLALPDNASAQHVVLFHFEGLSQVDVAETMGVSAGRCGIACLARARRALARQPGE